jgi:dolichol-phosphate mannosyltransferase
MKMSIVVPVYNEELVLPEFHRRLCATIDTLPHSSTVWYVNDGSTDRTEDVLCQIIREDDRVRLLNLSRSFGQQAALTAGLDCAGGDVVIMMDGDGQHPPRYIVDLLDCHEQGFDIVLTQRGSQPEQGFLKKSTSWLFYRFLSAMSASRIIPDAADFRLMSREVVSNLRRLRERHRFLRGMVTWMGFRWTTMRIEPSPRIAGESKYGILRMVRLAYEAVFSFSVIPIRLSILLGVFVLGVAFLQFLDPLILILRGRGNELVPGWTTLIISVLVLGATQLITLAIVGQYVGLIYEEVKGRPLYVVRGKPVDWQELEERDHDE